MADSPLKPLGLHNLKSQPSRQSKRLGRGNASGRGTTAGRGTKGQRARSGGRKGLQAKALKSFFGRIPKSGGFTSLRAKAVGINVGDLARYFPAGATVTPEALRRKYLAPARRSIKILADGTIGHALTIRGCKISAEALKKITAAGGSVAT